MTEPAAPGPAQWLDPTTPAPPPEDGQAENAAGGEPATLAIACADPDCAYCQVTGAGARVLCELVGVDYDTLGADHQAHYRTICGEVMAAMSATILETGLAR